MIDLDLFPEADRELIAQLSPVVQEGRGAMLKRSEAAYRNLMADTKRETDEELRRRANRTRGIPNIGMG